MCVLSVGSSWIGAMNRAFAELPESGVYAFDHVAPPFVVRAIVRYTYSPNSLLGVVGWTITSAPSPPFVIFHAFEPVNFTFPLSCVPARITGFGRRSTPRSTAA